MFSRVNLSSSLSNPMPSSASIVHFEMFSAVWRSYAASLTQHGRGDETHCFIQGVRVRQHYSCISSGKGQCY